MNDKIQYFAQAEYSRILNLNNARERGLSQSECVRILVKAGASYKQADNGSYVYIHHGNYINKFLKGSQSEYFKILDEFGARGKSSQECIKYLENVGYSYGQSKTAVYKYRVKNNLIGK